MNDKILGVIVAGLFMGSVPVFSAPSFARDTSRIPQQEKLSSYLNDLQTNRNPNVRARAASYLGMLKNPAALPALNKSLTSDINEQVRINAANAIGRINQKASVKQLLQAIRPNRGKTDVQIAIIRSIGDMGDNSKEYVPVISKFLRSPNPYIREAVAEALWKIRDPRSTKVMNALLKQEKELVVQLSLMKYIADFKSPESIPLLEKIIADPKTHIDVRSLARDALDKLETIDQLQDASGA